MMIPPLQASSQRFKSLAVSIVGVKTGGVASVSVVGKSNVNRFMTFDLMVYLRHSLYCFIVSFNPK